MRSNFVVKACVFMAWLRRNRRIRPKAGPVRVNLGSGLVVAPGWFNIDVNGMEYVAKLPERAQRAVHARTESREWFTPDEYVRNLNTTRHVHHGLQYGVPFADGSVDAILTSHTVEHFHPEDAKALLKDACRALKPGGRIRVSVPDLRMAMRLMEHPDTVKQGLSYFFADPKLPPFAHHRYMYDALLMEELLHEAGFREVRVCGFREGQVPDLDVLDVKPDESLFVEAVKPLLPLLKVEERAAPLQAVAPRAA